MVVPLSVAITLNEREPETDGLYSSTALPPLLTIVFVEITVPLSTRFTVNGPVPTPLGMDTLYGIDWPKSNTELLGVSTTVGAVFTRIPVCGDDADTGVEALSVTLDQKM